MIMLGFILMGITYAAFDMPFLIDLNSTLINKYNYSESSAHDISSSIYLFCNYSSDSFGPMIGGYLTEMIDFEFSCAFFGLLSLVYFMVLVVVYRVEIISRIQNLLINNQKIEADENILEEKLLEKDDFSMPEKITEKNLGEKLRNRKKLNLPKKKVKTTTSLLYMIDVSKDLDFEL